MFKTILVNIAILLGLFLLMEAAVRVFVPQIGPLGVDSSLIHSGRFGDTHGLARSSSGSNYGVTTRTTPDGFIAYTTQRQDASPDETGSNWLLLGDSVTMPIGVQSDSSFAGRMAHAVSDSVRALNSALIGYSSFDYLNVAGNIIGLGEPALDRVILFWCLNDVYGDGDVPGGSPAPAADRPTVRQSQGAFMRFMNRNVYSYQWLMATVSDRGQAYFEYDRQFYSEDDPGFAAVLDRIAIIRDMAEFNGIRFDLVMMPYEYQYRSGGFHPQDVLMDALQDKGIRTYDARGAFDGVADITGMYMYADGIHFSEQGHRLIWHWLRSEYLPIPANMQ